MSSRRLLWLICVLILALGAGLCSGCLMHDSACYDRCMAHHRHCITQSQSSAALEECDARLARCRGGCTW
jgi:hypothetical protein